MIRIPFFRIFYSTTFLILLLLTIALLAVSPADEIYQSLRDDQRSNVIVIAGVYLLVVLVILFIYAVRLYSTRLTLAAIPKSRLPLQKGALNESVRRMILTGIDRSASIAFRVRPRDLTEQHRHGSSSHVLNDKPSSKPLPTWGDVVHAGWAGPDDPEMPNSSYSTVIKELPSLLEARAVSLAPQLMDDRTSEPGQSDSDAVASRHADPTAVFLLQRPDSSSLRSYIARLFELGVLPDELLSSDFLTLYEKLRFSGDAASGQDFRLLLGLFAQLLDEMREPDPRAMEAAIIDLPPPSAGFAHGIHYHKVNSRVNLNAEGWRRSDESLAGRRVTPVTAAGPVDVHGEAASVHSQETFGSRLPFSTPGMISETPFFTPYPRSLAGRTASTGSLAGSEGTNNTASSKRGRRAASAKRTQRGVSQRSTSQGSQIIRRSRRTPDPIQGALSLSSHRLRADRTGDDDEMATRYSSTSLDTSDAESEIRKSTVAEE